LRARDEWPRLVADGGGNFTTRGSVVLGDEVSDSIVLQGRLALREPTLIGRSLAVEGTSHVGSPELPVGWDAATMECSAGLRAILRGVELNHRLKLVPTETVTFVAEAEQPPAARLVQFGTPRTRGGAVMAGPCAVHNLTVTRIVGADPNDRTATSRVDGKRCTLDKQCLSGLCVHGGCVSSHFKQHGQLHSNLSVGGDVSLKRGLTINRSLTMDCTRSTDLACATLRGALSIMGATCTNGGDPTSLASCELTGSVFTPEVIAVPATCTGGGDASSRAACEDTGNRYTAGVLYPSGACCIVAPTCTNGGNASLRALCEKTGHTFDAGVVGVPASCTHGGNASSRGACERTGSSYDVGSGARVSASVDRVSGDIVVGQLRVSATSELRGGAAIEQGLLVQGVPSGQSGANLTSLTVLGGNVSVGGSVAVAGRVQAGRSLSILASAAFQKSAYLRGIRNTGSLRLENRSGGIQWGVDVTTGDMVTEGIWAARRRPTAVHTGQLDSKLVRRICLCPHDRRLSQCARRRTSG
jgi:hypothetical protein